MDTSFPRRSLPTLVLGLAVAVLLLGFVGCGAGSPLATGIQIQNAANTTGGGANTHAISSLRIVEVPGGAFQDYGVSIAPGGSQFFALPAGVFSVLNLVYDDGQPAAAAVPSLLLIVVSPGGTTTVTVSHGP